jgi:hypothetical protein
LSLIATKKKYWQKAQNLRDFSENLFFSKIFLRVHFVT